MRRGQGSTRASWVDSPLGLDGLPIDQAAIEIFLAQVNSDAGFNLTLGRCRDGPAVHNVLHALHGGAVIVAEVPAAGDELD